MLRFSIVSLLCILGLNDPIRALWQAGHLPHPRASSGSSTGSSDSAVSWFEGANGSSDGYLPGVHHGTLPLARGRQSKGHHIFLALAVQASTPTVVQVTRCTPTVVQVTRSTLTVVQVTRCTPTMVQETRCTLTMAQVSRSTPTVVQVTLSAPAVV